MCIESADSDQIELLDIKICHGVKDFLFLRKKLDKKIDKKIKPQIRRSGEAAFVAL